MSRALGQQQAEDVANFGKNKDDDADIAKLSARARQALTSKKRKHPDDLHGQDDVHGASGNGRKYSEMSLYDGDDALYDV